METETIVNKVANSGIVIINLEDYLNSNTNKVFDIKEHLYMGLMLREAEFRDFVKTNDWEQYRNCNVAITCTSDAIVPTWAYMLVANKLVGIANYTVFGDLNFLEQALFIKALDSINLEPYIDKRVVVKGCSDKPVPTNAYVAITNKLTPIVKTLMFGEPCSTVPIYKKAK